VKVLHLTKNKDGELKSRFIWDTNPLNKIRSALEQDLKGTPTYEAISTIEKQVTMICFQNIDVMEYASKKYKIDWKKLQLEFYSKQGWIEGEYDWRE
tara:strand:+ start:603 stop:893 length:291 start_codon:yes stop_codon:yes gene_type:complete